MSKTIASSTVGLVALLVALTGFRAVQAQQPLQVTVDANNVWIRAGQAPILQYRYGDVPFKPYVKELYTPSGLNVLLDAPPDHLHHHGLMLACAVDNVDFWGEAPSQPGGHFEPLPGRQHHMEFSGVGVVGPEGHRLSWFAESVFWGSGPDRKPLLFEHRAVTARRIGTPMATVVTWASMLTPANGRESVVLSGAHYHGLGMRFIRSMDNDGEFRNPDNDPGVVFRGEERLSRSRWCAYTAKADGKLVTVAMFDHPENPRHPATWFTMAKPFAYMSATLRLHEEPLKVVANRRMALRYAVALWDGRPETSQIEELYGAWKKSPSDVAWSYWFKE